MSLIAAGDWDAENGVVNDPAFTLRAPRTPPPPRAELLFAKAVYAADQCERQGMPITADTLRVQNPDLTLKFVTELLTTDKFRHALEQRGLRLPHESGLSPEQLATAAIYMDMTVPMNHAQKLRAAGISDAKWKGWMRQPAFAAYISEISEDSLRSSIPVANQRLAALVDQGNQKAMELLYEITGRHDRRQDNVDVGALLLGLFTILDEEISPLPGGVGVLQRVNAKVKAMMGAEAAPVLRISPQTAPAPAPPPPSLE